MTGTSRFFSSSIYHSYVEDDSDFSSEETNLPSSLKNKQKTTKKFFENAESSSDEEAENAARDLFSKRKESSTQYSSKSIENSASYVAEEDDGEVYIETSNALKMTRNELLAQYLNSSSSSEDEDELGTKKVLRSHREKYQKNFSDSIQEARDTFDEYNWTGAMAALDKLQRLLSKGESVGLSLLEVRSTVVDFLDLCEELDEEVKNVTAEEIRDMSATNAKTLNALKQYLKKTPKTISDDYDYLLQQSIESLAANLSSTDLKETSDGQKKLTTAEYFAKISEILQQRGKKKIEQSRLVEALKNLLPEAPIYIQARVYVALIAILLEYNQVAFAFLPIETWREIFDSVSQLLDLLCENKQTLRLKEDAEELFKEPADDEMVFVKGNLTSYLVRIDDEFSKSMLFIDPCSEDYQTRLAEEPLVMDLLEKAMNYLTEIGTSNLVDLLAFRMLDHFYFRKGCHEKVLRMNSLIKQEGGFVGYKKNLYMCFSYSTHGLIEEAAACLASVIKEEVHNYDINTQILYFRCLVKYGFACFEKNEFKRSFESFSEVFNSSTKPRDLIGQSFNRYSTTFFSYLTNYTEKSIEERSERLRQVPYHMHFNLDNLETVFFLVSMIYDASHFADGKRKTQGRNLKKAFDATEKSLFAVPPEHSKEFIIAAVGALLNGDWCGCEKLLQDLKVWNIFGQTCKTSFILMLKVEFVRNYLNSFLPCYSIFSLESLRTDMRTDVDDFKKILEHLFGAEKASLIVSQQFHIDCSVIDQSLIGIYGRQSFNSLQEKINNVITNFSISSQ